MLYPPSQISIRVKGQGRAKHSLSSFLESQTSRFRVFGKVIWQFLNSGTFRFRNSSTLLPWRGGVCAFSVSKSGSGTLGQEPSATEPVGGQAGDNGEDPLPVSQDFSLGTHSPF